MSPDPRLARLLQRWNDLQRQGEKVDPAQLCADCPELLDEFLRRLEGLGSKTVASDGATHTEEMTRDRTTVPSTTRPLPAGCDIKAEHTTLYDQLQFHARGGLGEVFLARDGTLHRGVALKFLQTRHLSDPTSLGRFLLEAEVTAQLEHPGVVPVYGVGQMPDGQAFYAMRFIRGETLHDAIRRLIPDRKQPLDTQTFEFRSLLNRFVSVCHTIAYAHNRGILHRDIKPENIMLGAYGETLVVDWGLALSVDRDDFARASGEPTLKPSLESSASGGRVGTPGYMSPEQAAGTAELTPASDIYSLGVVLYRMLAEQPPFQASHPREVMDKVRAGKFLPPRQVRRGVPRPLEAICLKAMAYNPADRYPSASHLADDVERWLADEPVAAYESRWFERAGRWARHNRTWASSAAIALVAVLVVLLTAAAWLGRMAHRERTARLAAQQMREQRLGLAAKFAARTVASEIDLRWRILEAEATDPDLQKLLSGPSDQQRARSLQDWINARFVQHLKATGATSWFLTDAQGNQIARSPYNPKTIGKNYAFRDYFHGQGLDLAPEQAAGILPISTPHRSVVFESQATGNLMVAYSVPVQDPSRQVIGVLAMTVELGQFISLQLELGPDQVAVLADTKSDWIEGKEGVGLILHHPKLYEQQLARHQDPSLQLPRLSPERVKALQQLRARRRLTPEAAGSETPADEVLDTSYRDPVTPGGGDWIAAFEPVMVKGRDEETADTGWVVIVQERRN